MRSQLSAAAKRESMDSFRLKIVLIHVPMKNSRCGGTFFQPGSVEGILRLTPRGRSRAITPSDGVISGAGAGGGVGFLLAFPELPSNGNNGYTATAASARWRASTTTAWDNDWPLLLPVPLLDLDGLLDSRSGRSHLA